MQQLNDGIRMLQMQAHNSSGVIRLCHSSCVCTGNGPVPDRILYLKKIQAIYDGGTLEDYLKIGKSFITTDHVHMLIAFGSKTMARCQSERRYGSLFSFQS